MKRRMVLWALTLITLSSLACTLTIPSLPDVEVPRLEVGEMEEYTEEIAGAGVTSAEVNIRQGVGELWLAAGEADSFFSGTFTTNVVEWAPQVTWEGGELNIEQSSTTGIPGAGAENEWEMVFSPAVALDFDLDLGAVDCELDMTGLAVTGLRVESGASDLVVRFDEPNRGEMERLDIEIGAANLDVSGIGNASPQRVRVNGGVGNIILDLTGAWFDSAQIDITTGTGALTLRLPSDVGVQIEMEGGLGNVEADQDLNYEDGVYTNDAFGQTAIDLLIDITVGIGSVELELE